MPSKKEWVKPKIERQAIFSPQNIIFSGIGSKNFSSIGLERAKKV